MHTNNKVSRYSRQLLVPALGVEGQKRLLQASVLVVGAGVYYALQSPSIKPWLIYCPCLTQLCNQIDHTQAG